MAEAYQLDASSFTAMGMNHEREGFRDGRTQYRLAMSRGGCVESNYVSEQHHIIK